jgi:hypothetical protein
VVDDADARFVELPAVERLVAAAPEVLVNRIDEPEGHVGAVVERGGAVLARWGVAAVAGVVVGVVRGERAHA